MPTGFGGSARLALLTGIVGGMNAREETKNKREREAILNQQAQQMIAESAARVKNYSHEQERQIRADQIAEEERQRALVKEQEETARREASLQRTAESIARQINQPVEDVLAILQYDPNAADDLLAQIPDPVSDLDRANSALKWQQYEDARREMQRNEELDALYRDQRFGLLRRSVRVRDEEQFNRLYEEMKKDYPLAIDSWLDDELPDENQGLDASGRAAAKADGANKANWWLNRAEQDPMKALTEFSKFQAFNPPTTPEEEARDQEIIRILRDAYNRSRNKTPTGSASSETPSFSNIESKVRSGG